MVSALVVAEYVSLDGAIQAPGYAGEDPEGGFAHGGWTGPFMADHRRYNSQLYPTAALADGPAQVLGCSGGALTGLELVARHPERVRVLVAHEPPAMNLLADGAGWQAAFQAVEDTWRREGAGPGMQQFITTAVRTGGPKPAEAGSGPASEQAPAEMPDMSQMSPEMLEGMARMQANSEFFLAHLLPTTIGHVPDIAALRAASPRIVVGVGEASQGQMPHLAALALAERLDSKPVEFPGDHQGFATHPGPFAETVHKALRGS